MTPLRRTATFALLALVAGACAGGDDTDQPAATNEPTSSTADGDTDTAADEPAPSDEPVESPTDGESEGDQQAGSDQAGDDTEQLDDDAGPLGDDAGGADAPAAPDDGATEATESSAADSPAVYDGERVLVLGSNPWPIVGDLLSLGVTPAIVIGQEGRGGAPDYLLARYGDELAEVTLVFDNLFAPNTEQLAQLDFDRVIAPDFFEPFIVDDDVTSELLDRGSGIVYVDVTFWPSLVEDIVEGDGVDPTELLDQRRAEYDARLGEIAAALPYDPSTVEFSTFQWNEDGSILLTAGDAPIVQVLSDLGFVPHPSLDTDDFSDLSGERVLELDSGLSYVQMRGVTFESFLADPLWSTSRAATTGNVFERFQYAQQAGWIETLTLIDQLATELPTVQPPGS